MIEVHVKNLEKYQPSYTDRRHYWAKIHYEILLDPVVQRLNEIDRYRFISLIVYETYLMGKPLILTDTNLSFLGWDKKKRSISLSLQMLHTLVDVRDVEPETTVTQIRVDKSRVEKKKEKTRGVFVPPNLEEVKKYISENPELNNIDPEDFWRGYDDGGWIDTRGEPVRNWKLKLRTRSKYATPKERAPVCVVDHNPGYKYQLNQKNEKVYLCEECMKAFRKTHHSWGELPISKIEKLVLEGKAKR